MRHRTRGHRAGTILLAGLLAGAAHAAMAEAPPETPQAQPSAKNTPAPKDNAYRQDSAYRAILRYDYLPYWLNREKELRLQDGEDQDPTIHKKDRPLVLTGRGFKIIDLQPSESPPGLGFNPYHYVENETHRPPFVRPPDRLDPALDQVESNRELIFHSKASGFYNVGLPPAAAEPLPEPPPPAPPRPVPQTRLIISTNGHTQLLLSPAPRQWDLLQGNEEENRRDFFENR